MKIIEVSKDLMRQIADAGMSPPIVFGRIRLTTATAERWFIGVGTEDDMHDALSRIPK